MIDLSKKEKILIEIVERKKTFIRFALKMFLTSCKDGQLQ